MPRNQGTSRKGKPGKKDRAVGLGMTLKRAQGQPRVHVNSSHTGGMAKKVGVTSIGVQENNDGSSSDAAAGAHTTSTTTKSILELQDIDDFLLQAELANREFVAERHSNLTIEDATSYAYRGPSRVQFQDQQHGSAEQSFVFQELSVPRRPAWDASTTPQELQEREQKAFLDWRRAIALKEEELMARSRVSVTPFEKNLEVWRQLWRVLERSACLLQLVDARNPLFYLSKDLRDYATSLGNKPMMVLVNKSDYLTKKQRQVWYDYLTANGWENVVFFSAHQEQQKLDEQAQQKRRQEQQLEQQQYHHEQVEHRDVEEEEEEEGNGDDPMDPEAVSAVVQEEGGGGEEAVPHAVETEIHVQEQFSQQEDGNDDNNNDNKGIDVPLTRQQLIDTMLAFALAHECRPDPLHSQNRIPFGMVGFPNVGKSSVINVLMGNSKHTHGLVRVGVASQPGKTKHFQTLLLNQEMLLCDCPGLVFPSFVSNTADLIAAGVYPIAQMRDPWPVVSLICQRIPREILNAQYGIQLPLPPPVFNEQLQQHQQQHHSPPTAEELLSTYCYARGMLAAASGVPDYMRAARLIIQDYATGKLLYCHAPPSATTTTTTNAASTASSDSSNRDSSDRNNKEEETVVGGTVDGDEYARETFMTALQNTKKLRDKLLQQQPQHDQQSAHGDNHNAYEEPGATAASAAAGGDVDDVVDDDLLAQLMGVERSANTATASSSSHKKHYKNQPGGKNKKKNRDNNNKYFKDPYGCHASPDELLVQQQLSRSSISTTTSTTPIGGGGGVAVKAGKHSRSGYTRPTYAGARGVLPA